jgi:hypothetical protein
METIHEPWVCTGENGGLFSSIPNRYERFIPARNDGLVMCLGVGLWQRMSRVGFMRG